MKKRLISALCALLLTGAMLSGCSEMPDKEEKSTVISIWYVQGDLMSEALAAQAELFNQTARDISVELKVYAGESELASALDSARPDMILCGHERAFSLYEQQRLRDISAVFSHAPAFRQSFLTGSGCVGSSFFPLGAETELLAVNGPAFESSGVSGGGREIFATLEGICSAASACGQTDGRIFFTADSFSALFAGYLTKAGGSFRGVRAEDIKDETFVRTYNLLAEAAYNRGLAGYDSPALPLVESGEVVCALVPSTALRSASGGEIEIYPMPSPEGGEELCLAEAVGLAVTSPFAENEAAIARFLTWLYQPERAVPLALSGGLIPAVEGSLPQNTSPLAELLYTLASSGLYLPGLDSGYANHGAEFEQSFRTALEMLG